MHAGTSCSSHHLLITHQADQCRADNSPLAGLPAFIPVGLSVCLSSGNARHLLLILRTLHRKHPAGSSLKRPTASLPRTRCAHRRRYSVLVHHVLQHLGGQLLLQGHALGISLCRGGRRASCCRRCCRRGLANPATLLGGQDELGERRGQHQQHRGWVWPSAQPGVVTGAGSVRSADINIRHQHLCLMTSYSSHPQATAMASRRMAAMSKYGDRFCCTAVPGT